MIAEPLLHDLLRFNLAASAAVVLVLMLRPLVLARLGAQVTYWLWILVPLVVMAGFLPARERIVEQAAAGLSADIEVLASAVSASAPTRVPVAVDAATPALPDPNLLLATAWLLVAAALLVRSVLNTYRAANSPLTGPALIGVLWPKLVLPEDFDRRFDAQERVLILAHENVHRRSGHTLVNALLELVRCACWFNPLAHFAASRMRADQELACDAAVIAAYPAERRTYAQALLKAQTASAFLPLGCTWTSRSARRLHERISVLAQPVLNWRRALVGVMAIVVLALPAGYAAWAQQPERIVVEIGTAEPPVWTPSAQAPPGTLSHQLEGQRHDLFIERAQQGDIDFVLFGTTDAEMFWWPDRGKAVWDSAFAGIQAANFGAQGTSPRSLLWRMRNGELDGYRAKLIVVQAGFCMGGGAASAGGPGVDPAAVFNNCTPILMEIRAQQPQAMILLLPPFPRGTQDVAAWAGTTLANQMVFSQFVDSDRVFYTDFGKRFFREDGSHDQTMWSRTGFGGVGVGIQKPAFEAWAEELKPWLERALITLPGNR